MTNEKVLITGGAGYIGCVLTDLLLKNGYNVTVLDNLTFGYNSLIHLIDNPNFEFIYGDARDEEAMKELIPKFDILIPLAAIVGAPQCNLNPVDAKLLNRDAVVFMNKIKSPSQKLIFPNTNSGYGVTTGENYCTEETPLNPISIYGKTKCEAENELLKLKKGVIVLRLATVFGMSPRMRTDLLVNHFVFKAASDGYIVVYEKDFKRNYVHVKDVARCFLHCIKNWELMKNKVFNVGLDSANLSKQELSEKIIQYFPKFDVTYKEIGKDIDKRNYIVSNKRLNDTGFRCMFDLDFGIDELKKGYYLMFKKEVFRQ